MIFKRFLLFVVTISLIITAACNSSQQEKATSAQIEIPKYTLPPVVKEPVPAAGGEFSFPIPVNPATLNPLKVKNVELFNLFSLIYEKPIRIGVDGKAQPELIETWSVDETGTVWTFVLRKGVKWQNDYGELTTNDLLYTIGLIKTYAPEESSFARYNSQIVSYTAVDAYTLSVSFEQPGNAPLYFMTFPIMCKDYCEAVDIDSAKPIGTGPYVVTENNLPEGMTLDANTVWWKQQPYIPRLTAIGYPDHNTEMIAFEQKLLDVITTSALTVDTYKKYDEVVYVDYMTQYYDCLIPNTSGLFSDPNLRQAIAYALDKRDIISKALLGHAVAVDYPIPPDSYLSGGSSNIYEYNQQKAMELLELSGWKERDNDGIVEKIEGTEIVDLTFELLVSTSAEDPYRHDVAENIASQLKSCGMDVVIREVDAEVHKQSLEAGSFDLALCTLYLNVNPDISSIVATGGIRNYGGFSDIELDTLLESCKAALDEQAMKDAYLAMEDRFLTSMPHIGLYFRTNALLYNASLIVSDGLRDRNLFSTVPSWYMFVKEAGE